MVRNYRAKRPKKYTSCDLEAAIKEMANSGVSLKAMKEKYGIPMSTLSEHSNQIHIKKHGHDTVLSQSEEYQIAKCLMYAGDYGWPLNRHDLRSMVQSYCVASSIKTPWDSLKGPGLNFVRNFEKRWHHLLTKRKTVTLTTARVKSLTRDTLSSFFNMVKLVYDEHGFHQSPALLYNLDETGLNTDQSGSKSYFRRGVKDANIISPTCGKTIYSILVCGNADGSHLLPSLVVYKSKYLHSTWCLGGPSGAMYSNSLSGWMESDQFYNWMLRFVKHKKDHHGNNYIVLFMDGHSSHLTFRVATLCLQNHIILICLPPNSTHALQPLDVGFFSPIKSTWKCILQKWYRESRLAKVEKSTFPTLLSLLWGEIKASNLVGGFRGTGLFPWI